MQTYPSPEAPIPIGGGIFVAPDLMQKLTDVVSEDKRRALESRPLLTRKEIEDRVGEEFGLISGALGRIRKANELADRQRSKHEEWSRRGMVRPAPSPVCGPAGAPPDLPNHRDALGNKDMDQVRGYVNVKDEIRQELRRERGAEKARARCRIFPAAAPA